MVVLGWPVPEQYTLAHDLAIILLFCPVIIALGASLRPPACLTTACRVLGEVSYPIYVIHFPLIFATGFFAKLLGVPDPVWSTAFVFAIGAAALIASRVYDQPVRAWLTAKARERRARAPAAAAQRPS